MPTRFYLDCLFIHLPTSSILILMKIYNLLIFSLLTSLIISCSSGKQITSAIQKGQSAYQSGQYENALKYYEEVIAYYDQNNQPKECPVYYEAAMASLELKQKKQAIDFFKIDQYSNHTNPETYIELSKLYREKDNLSKELEELETYVTNYPEGSKLPIVQERLFELYVESQNWEKAENEWNNLSEETKSGTTKLEEYFIVNSALDKDSVCGVIAADLLKIDDSNKIGLDYTAKKYFWKAEKRYAAELKAYEANKTNKQYKKLLKALDLVSADFKTSLGYFKKLYLLDPTPQYAKYMGDIYNRLDDKKKADYYYRISKGND